MPPALPMSVQRFGNIPDDGTNDDAVAMGINRRASMPRVSFLAMPDSETGAGAGATPYLPDYTGDGVLRSVEVEMRNNVTASSTAGLRNSQIFAREQARNVAG